MSMGRMLGSMIGMFGGRALGGMIGGPTGRMIGSLAGSMLGGRGARGGAGGIGSLLGDMMGGDKDKAEQAASQMDDADAQILIRAMCNAAKADGQVDESEVQNILSRLGELTAEEETFLRQELSTPLDTKGFLATVPMDMANEVYTMSLLAIDVDTAEEADYLRDLARDLEITDEVRGKIHEALGAN